MSILCKKYQIGKINIALSMRMNQKANGSCSKGKLTFIPYRLAINVGTVTISEIDVSTLIKSF